MVKVEKHDLVETTSGAMNRLWKRQEQDWGIDICFQQNGAGNGTILRTKGERHDRHTELQQQYRRAWCTCDNEYSRLPESEKLEWRRRAGEYNRAHGANLSGYNLYMKTCLRERHEGIGDDDDWETDDAWVAWDPDAWSVWAVLYATGDPQPVQEPTHEDTHWSLRVDDDLQAMNQSRTWGDEIRLTGAVMLDDSSELMIDLGPFPEDDFSEPFWQFSLDASDDTMHVAFQGPGWFNWSSTRHTTVPSKTWLSYEIEIDTPYVLDFRAWTEGGEPVANIRQDGFELDSGWIRVIVDQAVGDEAFLGPIWKSPL